MWPEQQAGTDAIRFRALEALASLTAAIARATSQKELYDAALSALAEAVGARRAAVLLFDHHGVMRFCAWRGLSGEYRARAEGHSPWRPDEKNATTLVVPDSEADPELASLRPAFRREGIRALAFIPLVARRRLIGKFMVYWDEPHQPDPGELEAMLGIAERVALGIERLRNEEALRTSRDQLEAILRGIGDGVTVLDRSGRLVFANPAAARLLGMAGVEDVLATPAEEILDRFELLDDEGRPLDAANLPTRRALLGQTPPATKLRFRSRADGAERWSILTCSPVRGAQGEVDLVISIFRDVTAEEVAIGRERFLAGMSEILAGSLDFEATLTALARLAVPTLADWCRIDMPDANGKPRAVAVEHRNPAMVARALEMMRRHPIPKERNAIARVIETGERVLYPVISDEMLEEGDSPPEFVAFLREIGIRSLMIVPLTARGRTLAALSLIATARSRRYGESDLAFAEDVARRAALALDNALLFRAEQEARQREAQARGEAEMANRAKDEFLATLSHELRTPLTAILGWSRMLTTMNADPSLREEGLVAIARSAEAQTRIVEDLLDISRIVTGKLHLVPGPVRLRRVLEAAAASVRPAAEAKRITVSLDGVPEAVVRGDPDRLQQVFWNLLANAVRFTRPGGRIDADGVAEAKVIRVRVRDTGTGIRADLLPHVFERFRQGDTGTTRAYGGLGLGLAIVKSLVELHGGSVTASSEGEGRGACFTVELPLDHGSSEAQGVKHSTDPKLAGRKVLIVEDDSETRTFLGALLRRTGAEVRESSDVQTGLAHFREWLPDLVISDIAMPGEDGYELIRRIRSHPAGGGVPAVALTAYGRDEDRLTAIEAGFTTFLRKPVDPRSFVLGLAELLRPVGGEPEIDVTR